MPDLKSFDENAAVRMVKSAEEDACRLVKDLRLDLRIRNNQLLERREKAELTQVQVAVAARVSLDSYAGLEAMRLSPFTRGRFFMRNCIAPACGVANKGLRDRFLCDLHRSVDRYTSRIWREARIAENPLLWSNTARRISDFYEARLEDLWPEAVLAVEQSRVVRLVGREELEKLMAPSIDELVPRTPEDAVISMNLAEQIRNVLATLTPREEKVLRMRFGIGEKSDYTLEEIGQDFGVTRARIRQVEAKALRKLRHPSRSKRLNAFI